MDSTRVCANHFGKPHSDAMPAKSQTGDRYQISGEIARGGMGAVLRGDVDLGRDLAIKVLLEKYADHPEVARRFLEEAQIGGQLQHPGVVLAAWVKRRSTAKCQAPKPQDERSESRG